MAKVYWCPTRARDGGITTIPDIAFQEPDSFFKELSSKRESAYLKCPSVIEYCKNIFIIRSPYDVTITINRKFRTVTTSFPKAIRDDFVSNRTNDFGENDPYLLSLPPNYIFYSDDDIIIESLPCFLLESPSIKNINLIPGTFNISKWVRPVDFSFEVKDDKELIQIKEGDPLFLVKFITKNGEKVSLERVYPDDKLKRVVGSCISVKTFNKNLPLKVLYKMAEPVIKLYLRKTKKCPFGFGKK